MTPVPSETVAPPRVLECPVQLEAKVAAMHGIADDDERQRGGILCIEAPIQRVHADQSILQTGRDDHIDPDKWRPLIMSFQKFYGLGPPAHKSTLAQIPESMYRSPDVDRGRVIASMRPLSGIGTVPRAADSLR